MSQRIKHQWGWKLTIYWFTGVESPGQLFDGLQLTDSPSKFSTQEHWTSTPESIPLTEASVFQKQQQAGDRMYLTHEYVLLRWNHHCISTDTEKVTTESIYYLLDDLDVRIVGKNSFWCECTLESIGVNSREGGTTPTSWEKHDLSPPICHCKHDHVISITSMTGGKSRGAPVGLSSGTWHR